MPTCFVIQPFDSGKYDKRFDDVFAPAITDAGLEPYRVDRDHSVDIPIESIEAGIRNAAIVFADITADNPNVWYELGVAFALGKPVVMVCSKERTKYPFDIQHRSVISYHTDAPSDFNELRGTITDRAKAALNKSETIQRVADSEQVAPVAGLSQSELFVLSVLAGSVMPTDDSNVGVYALKGDVERAGLTAVGFSLGVRRLMVKGLVEATTAYDQGESYDALQMTDAGWRWIDVNEDRFLLRKAKVEEPVPGGGGGRW